MKKRFFSKLGAVVMTAVMALSMAATPAFAAIAPDQKGSITVNGVEDAVTVSAYKLLDVQYDTATQQPVDPIYSWTADVADWVRQNHPTYIGAGTDNAVQDAFSKAGTDEIAAFYDELSVAIKAGNPALTAAGTCQGNGTIDNLEMANYLILIENGMKVYRPSAVNVVPTWDDANKEWNMTNPTVTVKSSDAGMDKTVNEDVQDDNHDKDDSTNVSIGDTVNYDLRTNVPVYPANATAKGYQISDILSAGLTLDAASIKVYGVAADGAETLLNAGDAYTQNTPGQLRDGTPTSFTLVFDYEKIKDYAKIHVDYNAVVNENAVLTNGNGNEAHLEYNNNPYDDTSWKDIPDEVTVYTYGMKITKTDGDGQPLAGAKFELSDKGGNKILFVKEADGVYHKAAAGETGAAEVEVDAKGLLELKGLDAGDYQLTETVAPGGYNKLQKPVDITIVDADFDGVEDTSADAYIAKTVVNNKGFDLPVTGGMGTILFTAGGTILIASAVVLLMISRKKNNQTNA